MCQDAQSGGHVRVRVQETVEGSARNGRTEGQGHLMRYCFQNHDSAAVNHDSAARADSLPERVTLITARESICE